MEQSVDQILSEGGYELLELAPGGKAVSVRKVSLNELIKAALDQAIIQAASAASAERIAGTSEEVPTSCNNPDRSTHDYQI